MMVEECAVSYNRKPLNIKDDPTRGIVEIEGLRYSYELLQGLADVIPLNRTFKIIERKDGVITVQALEIQKKKKQ